MEVGARLALCRDAGDGAGRLAVDQDDALVALAHFRDVALDHHRLAVKLFEHLQERVQVLVLRRDVEDADAAVAVKRLDDDVLPGLAELEDALAVRGDQGRRHEGGEIGDEQFLRRVPHMDGVVDHQGLGMDVLEEMGGGDVGHVEGRVLAHHHDVET